MIIKTIKTLPDLFWDELYPLTEYKLVGKQNHGKHKIKNDKGELKEYHYCLFEEVDENE